MFRQASDIAPRERVQAYYRQISGILQHRIEKGEYKPGDQLPTESVLSKEFGVNRHTAREALKLLKHEGIVFGLPGKGNYVSEQRIRYRVSKRMRFSSSIMEAGMTPGTHILSCGITPADAELATKLVVPEGVALVKLQMVRFADSIPFMISTTTLPADRFTGLMERLNGTFSLYAILKEHYGIDAQRRESVFETVLPNDTEQRHLEIAPDVPLLLVRSLAQDQFGVPIEYVVTAMRGDIGCMVVDFI